MDPGHFPELIVIGIQNQNPLRQTLFDEEREKFLAFLEHEVIAFTDKNFRTSKTRILFG